MDNYSNPCYEFAPRVNEVPNGNDVDTGTTDSLIYVDNGVFVSQWSGSLSTKLESGLPKLCH